jgi:hypothetical protein
MSGEAVAVRDNARAVNDACISAASGNPEHPAVEERQEFLILNAGRKLALFCKKSGVAAASLDA